jgi:hypothetical protein
MTFATQSRAKRILYAWRRWTKEVTAGAINFMDKAVKDHKLFIVWWKSWRDASGPTKTPRTAI